MKIKRFQASTMREAMRQVREEQGPDAVILSSHRNAEGIELVAAVDYDASLMQQALRRSPADESEPVMATPAAPTMAAAQPVVAARPVAPKLPPMMPAAQPAMRMTANFSTDFSNFMPAAASAVLAAKVPAQAQPAMRSLPAAVVSTAAPDALVNMGLDAALVQDICSQLPQEAGEDRARFLPMGLLAKRLLVPRTDEVLEGGVIALIGPTGVGKTTTLAKLAARYIQKHGAHGVALVCTDHYRIGAQDQLATYGKLMGVPVYNANDARTLGQVLAHLKDARLVLVDTAGISQRDRKLAEQFITLSSQTRTVRKYLVLAANGQAESLDEAVRKFGGLRPDGLILTKIDEAARIGGALSVAMRHKLPIAYTCDGQRVPEDLQFARAERLVIRAMQLGRSATPEQAPAVSSGALYAAR